MGNIYSQIMKLSRGAIRRIAHRDGEELFPMV
jgi:hypothetical protein